MSVKTISIIVIVLAVLLLLAIAIAPSMLSSDISRVEERQQLEQELTKLREAKDAEFDNV